MNAGNGKDLLGWVAMGFSGSALLEYEATELPIIISTTIFSMTYWCATDATTGSAATLIT